MGRKLLIMPPYQPLEYRGQDDMEMRSAPYRGDGGYNDRAGVMRGGYYPEEPRRGGLYYDGPYMGVYEPEMRRGRDSRGRYTSRRSARMGGYDEPWMGDDDDDDMEMRYPSPDRVYSPKMKHRIGFSVDGEMERLPHREVETDYRTTADYQDMDEMEHRKGKEVMSGRASASGYMPFNKEMAMEWMESLENADGTRGPHWSMDQTKQVMAQKGVEGSPLDFYAAMNIMYSDFYPVAKKMGTNNIDFYTCMAKAFLDDTDAVQDKLSAYYTSVVKH